MKPEVLIGNSLHYASLWMAASGLPLQNSPTLERDAGTNSSSRKKFTPRLHLPQPHKQLTGFVEQSKLGSVSYKHRLLSIDAPSVFPIQIFVESTDF